jgi:iron complex transport system substrate-binding protein
MPPAAARRLTLLLALCSALQSAAQSIDVTDDRGVALRLTQPARRIVTLAPHLAELAYAAGAGSVMVGVSAHSDYPHEAGALPVVADAAGIGFERLLDLHPDLVLAWGSGTSPQAMRRLGELGVAVVATEPARLEDIPRIIRLIGRLADTRPTAERAAQDFAARLGRLRAEYAGQRPVTVFYQLWADPLMTVSARHLISDVIDLCGGKNIFAGLPGLTPTVSREAVLVADPDVILAAGAPQALEAWRGFRQARAVRAGALVAVSADLLQRASPRLLQGAAEVCRRLDAARQAGNP